MRNRIGKRLQFFVRSLEFIASPQKLCFRTPAGRTKSGDKRRKQNIYEVIGELGTCHTERVERGGKVVVEGHAGKYDRKNCRSGPCIPGSQRYGEQEERELHPLEGVTCQEKARLESNRD